MEEKGISGNELLPHLFRLEYTRLTAVLCRQFGLQHIEIAEDIASETFLKATELWSVNGIPENPVGWLYTVAKNKAKDYLKRLAIQERTVQGTSVADETQYEPDLDFSEKTIRDSQLAMIFAVCNPINSREARISLALQILCGFSVQEIADAFLTRKETVKKRLLRARINLRNNQFRIEELDGATIQSRQDTVLRTLYLLFNEGYFSRSGDHLIRKDLCSEAIRLTLLLTENPLTDTPESSALLALMCFQSSRLDARENEPGDSIPYEQQDKNLWSQELIERGNYYLVNACSGSEVSRYHLEAGIAYWHTTPTDEKKWEHILQLYNQLLILEYSPATALNRLFAYAKIYGSEAAIQEAETLDLQGVKDYHALMGYLYSDTDLKEAIAHFERAVSLTKSRAERKTLVKEMERLRKRDGSE